MDGTVLESSDGCDYLVFIPWVESTQNKESKVSGMFGTPVQMAQDQTKDGWEQKGGVDRIAQMKVQASR